MDSIGKHGDERIVRTAAVNEGVLYGQTVRINEACVLRV
jgi:hypothetical protein